MIKIEIYEDNGTLIVNGPALDVMTEEEYQVLDEMGKALKRKSRRDDRKRITRAIREKNRIFDLPKNLDDEEELKDIRCFLETYLS